MNYEYEKVITEAHKDELFIMFKSINKEHQMYIFLNFLCNIEPNIHTTTIDVTIFDINDLEKHPTMFWKIYNYTKLTIEELERESVLKNNEIEHNKVIQNLDNKINTEYKNLRSKFELDFQNSGKHFF